MRLLSVRDYADFECIGDKCPISCCGGNWSIFIDKESADFYHSVKGEFGNELRNGMIESRGNTMFKLSEDGNCIFLNENGLCRIYRNLGPDKLCITCRKFPRNFTLVGDILLCSLTTACPEAIRMIIQDKNPIKLIFADSDIQTDIAERLSGQHYNPDLDNAEFDNAFRAYIAGIHILQNRKLLLRDRMFLLLLFIERFQSKMKNEQNPMDLIGIFSDPDIYSLFLENNASIRDRDYISKIRVFTVLSRELIYEHCNFPKLKNCNELVNSIKSKENIDIDIDAFSEIYKKVESPKLQIEFEQIIVYRFFSSFLLGLEERDFFEKLAYEYILLMGLIIYMAFSEYELGYECSCEDRILFYSLCSRVDHATIGKKKFINILENNGFYNTEFLLKLIS